MHSHKMAFQSNAVLKMTVKGLGNSIYTTSAIGMVVQFPEGGAHKEGR